MASLVASPRARKSLAVSSSSTKGTGTGSIIAGLPIFHLPEHWSPSYLPCSGFRIRGRVLAPHVPTRTGVDGLIQEFVL